MVYRLIRYSKELLHKRGFEIVSELVKNFNNEKKCNLILECRPTDVFADTYFPDGCLVVKKKENLNYIEKLAGYINPRVGCDVVIDVCYLGPQVTVNDIEYKELAQRIEGRLTSFFKVLE